ncbi:MAG: phospholipase [Anaerolineae bacterium]|nr:phospholipase [Anaerolineae bacterium]
MTRKKRSAVNKSKKDMSMRLISLVVLLAIVIVAGVVYGGDAAIDLLGDMLGVDLSTLREEVSGPSSGNQQPLTGGQESSGSGSFYTLYFTEPSLYDSNTTSGGIEKHLIDLINSAQSSVNLAVFEFNLQNVADALISAHQRGVHVRIVYDNEHTEDDPQMAQMIKAGIPATPDNRGAYMHNKFFVFDNQLVWTGSWNVSVNDTFRNNNNAIVIRSTKLAENYTTEFEEMFNGQFGPTSPVGTPNPIFTLDGVRIENYFSPEDTPMTALNQVVSEARTSIHFMAFSFTEESLGQAMLDRAKAGVEVVGIFEQRGANTEYSRCPPMLSAGLDVRLDGNPRTFHHKVIIIDGAVVATGSFNFSGNAVTSNDENMLIIHDATLAAQYEAEFQKRMAEAVKPVGGECKSS